MDTSPSAQRLSPSIGSGKLGRMVAAIRRTTIEEVLAVSFIHRLTPVATLVALIVVLVTPLDAAAAPPAGWGWVVARNPTSASYHPAAKDQGNVSGASNSVERFSAGNYLVHLPGAATSDGGGNVQVSALNTNARYCTVQGWGGGPDIGIYVGCYRLNGTSVDSAFTAVFLQRGYNSGYIGYLWADQPTSTDYTPDTFYQSSGGSFTIHRSSAGHYLVRLPGFDADHGNVQVTGYGATTCKLGETSSDGTAMIIGVACPAGDSRFNLLYTKNVGLTGVSRPKAAYLRAFPLASGTHRTPGAFRYSSEGTTPTLTRSGVGEYVVTFPGMPKGGVAHVTAGPGADVCYLTKIRTNAAPQKVGVSCVTFGGAPADAAFDLSYTK